MKNNDIDGIMAILKKDVRQWKTPAVTIVAKSRDPFQVLVSCLISLRTKDEVTGAASKRLFALADNPGDMCSLSQSPVEKAIYPAGFYRNKARDILEISRILVDKYNSIVPDDIDELVKFKGVGRKTANLVVTLGYNKPGICVDIHVHRITNRWGYVKTKTPDQSEVALRKKLPEKYWIEINDLLVTFGQNLCTPVSPHCSKCSLDEYCERVGVEKRR